MTSPTSGTYTPQPGRGTCRSGKVQYANRKQARARARAMNDSALGCYRCEDCNWFHVGHMPQVVRNGRVDKNDWIRKTKAAKKRAAAGSFTPADMARLVERRQETA